MWEKEINTFNVGWLEGEGFPRGIVPDGFIKNLWEYVKYPVFMTRGFHKNIELDGEKTRIIVNCQGYTIRLGNAEIRVVDSKNDKIYASPNLIMHYIVNHNYLPPNEFIDAVMLGPKPNSEKYGSVISSIICDNERKFRGSDYCLYCGSNKTYYGFSHRNDNDESDSKILITSYKETDTVNKLKENTLQDKICLECGKRFTVPY